MYACGSAVLHYTGVSKCSSGRLGSWVDFLWGKCREDPGNNDSCQADAGADGVIFWRGHLQEGTPGEEIGTFWLRPFQNVKNL